MRRPCGARRYQIMSTQEKENTFGNNRARFSIEEICAVTGGALIAPAENSVRDFEVEGVSTDSRTVQKGALFIALKGERFDGHEYLQAARENGAAAAVVEKASVGKLSELAGEFPLIAVRDSLKAYGKLAAAHRKRFAVPVVAVTGSYGKTTTRALVVAALSPKYKVLSSRENFNNEVGVPQTLLQLDSSHQAVVIEMGMRGTGQIEYLAGLAAPDIGVITNIGPQHIELLGSVENIASVKAEVLRFLPQAGAAVLSADDEYLDFFTDQVEAAQIITFGNNPSAEYQVSEARIDGEGNVAFTIHNPHMEAAEVQLPVPGVHNATNAAAALAVAGALRVPLEAAARALKTAEIPAGRMRILKNETRGITLIDDSYNAGPVSVRAALETLRDFPGREDGAKARRIAVLGAMKELGKRSEEEHRSLGVLATKCADIVIGVGEEAKALLEEAEFEAFGEEPFEAFWCEDADGATEQLQKLVRDGDTILVKGSRSVGLETVVNALAG